VLGVCLEGSSLAQSSQVAVFSYSDDFSTLWELKGAQPLRSFSDGDFLIMVDDGWNRTKDLPEANKHLTALDWAVWFTLSRSMVDRSGQVGMPTIILLRNDAIKRPPNNDAERFWSMFPENRIPALPWIKIVSLIGRVGEPCCLLQLLQIIHAGESSLPRGDLSLIRQVWQSFFLRPTSPSDNHALANVLGAGLLTGDFGDSETRRALVKILRWLELVPSGLDSSVLESTRESIARMATAVHQRLPGKACGALRMLLVDDDQKRHGWLTFLGTFLGLQPTKSIASTWTGRIGKFSANLTATDSANEFLEKLKWCRVNAKSLRFKSDEPVDLVFLDLRLFERASLRDEAAFMLQVVGELQAINQTTNSNDWPKVDERELLSIENWCKSAISGSDNATRNDEMYIEALTLLPRLAAIIDPDLPIVLFSSTQRRHVVELLKPYGTIITSFSKPALQLGHHEQRLGATFESLERAIDQALAIVSSRKLRSSFLHEDFSVYWNGHVEKPVDEESDCPWSIQILIDEEGEGKLTVGGFLLVCPPGVAPSEVSDSIYSSLPQIRNAKNIRKKKKDGSETKLTNLLLKANGIAQTFGALIVPIAICGERSQTSTAHSQWSASSMFRDEMVADNLHRELMRCVIEVGLFVFARQILPEAASVEFHFHAPTRVLEVSEDEAKSLDKVWGIQSWTGERGGLIARHFGRDSARSLVDELFREYVGSTFQPEPVMARGFGLNSTDPAEVSKVHALHYLADTWLAIRDEAALSHIRKLSIEGNYGPRFVQLLEAHRYLVQEENAKAVAIGAPIAFTLKATQHSTAVNSIAIALQNAARALSGEERLLLAAMLRDADAQKAKQEALGLVHSVSVTDGSVKIQWKGKLFEASKRHLKSPVSVGDTVQFVPRRGNRPGIFLAKEVSKWIGARDRQEKS
jgi:hypothetical protein